MNVIVAGGHGKIGLRLLKLLAERGDTARGLIRNPDHAAALEAVGAEAIVADLETVGDVSSFLAGAEAVVFAAGAGPGSGAERKRTMDLGGAVALIEGAKRASVSRYVMVSSIGAHDPAGGAGGSESMRPYLEAKAEADEALRASGLAFTIVRPGSLTDDAGVGLVDVSTELGRRGRISRDDVAAILLATLHAPETEGLTFEAFAGDREVDLAVRSLSRANP